MVVVVFGSKRKHSLPTELKIDGSCRLTISLFGVATVVTGEQTMLSFRIDEATSLVGVIVISLKDYDTIGINTYLITDLTSTSKQTGGTDVWIRGLFVL